MTITLSYPAPYEGRTEDVLPWQEGKRLRDYLREKRLVARNTLCRTINELGEKVRLNYVPRAGEKITLKFTGRAMS